MKFNPAIWLFFIAYVAVAMLVLLNLVTAVIVDNALAISKQDEKQKLIELQQAKQAQITSLKRVFAALDVDGSGAIDESEFIDACTNRPEIMNKFRLLDFDEREMLNLFKDLEVSSDGLLSLEEFEMGLNSMQGDAKNKELVRIQKTIERLSNHVEMLTNRVPIKEGCSYDSLPTAFGRRKSAGRSRSPLRKSTGPSRSPLRKSTDSASSSTVLPSPSTVFPSPASELGSVSISLPCPPIAQPGISLDVQNTGLQHLDPSVRNLADVLVNHIGGLEQRMEQRFAMLEQRQTNALEALAAQLNTNSKLMDVEEN
jgi:Ca2+-binding EF-hand superfamily protein